MVPLVVPATSELSLNTFNEGGYAIRFDQRGTAGTILRTEDVSLTIVRDPKMRLNTTPFFRTSLTNHWPTAKFLATQSATRLAVLPWFSLLNRFINSPVLISTGHAVAHSPSTAHV